MDMIRRYLFALFIMLLPNMGVFAQEEDDPIEKMNNIKLEGTYYTGEATAATAQEAEELAKLMLMENLDGKNVDDLKSQLKKIEIKRGDMTMMFVYLPKNAKKEVTKTTPAPARTPAPKKTKTFENYTPNTEKALSVIDQLLESQTYTAVETIIRHAQYDNPAIKYGKPKDMANTDECYLIMIDQEWNVAGIISPKTDMGRKDLKTNQVVSSKDYPKCAVICLKIK